MPSTNKMPRRRITFDWKNWQVRVRNTRALIRKVKKRQMGMPEKWNVNMERHYTEVLASLAAVEPEKYEAW